MRSKRQSKGQKKNAVSSTGNDKTKQGNAASETASELHKAIGSNDKPTPPTKTEDIVETGNTCRKTTALVAYAGFLLWMLSTPSLLHKAGVIEKDPFDEFLAKAVYPSLERGLARINGTYGVEHESSEQIRPGYKLRKEGATAKYPIVIVPGFVTSGLELWAGEECAKKNFRQRLWGSVSMAKTFFSNRECWRRHLTLDPYTGSDPPNVRLRAAQGFEAADYFMATYWVWSKLIENLADVGYDGSMMTMMSYDWRLGFPILEERDGYFTKLRYTIEAYHKSTGEKVIVMSHSMGASVIMYFFAWVTADEKDGGGGGGKDWVEEHVHSYINIAGTLLGVPKAVPALLSGELKDTAALLSTLGQMLEQYFGRRLRKNLWNTWGSLFGMLPKGGDSIWGVGADLCGVGESLVGGLSCVKDGVDERFERKEQRDNRLEAPLIMWSESSCTNLPLLPHNDTTGPTDTIRDDGAEPPPHHGEFPSEVNESDSVMWSTDKTISYILEYGGGYGPTLSSSRMYSFDSETGREAHKGQWHNPVATPLPHAPSLKIYCMYGTGIATERAYFYKHACEENKSNENISECDAAPSDPPFVIDTSVEDAGVNITFGVKFTDGDASVPLLSLGYMCEAWKKGGRHNPGGAQIITREHRHVEEFDLADPIRGGPRSGEHVDILGHVDVMEDVLKIVTDFEVSTVKDRIVSDIKRIAQRIDSHPVGGLHTASAPI